MFQRVRLTLSRRKTIENMIFAGHTQLNVALAIGRTIARWRTQIVACHQTHVSIGPTEAINNLIKPVKPTAFGFRRFQNYRIQALPYIAQPNWDLPTTITPH